MTGPATGGTERGTRAPSRADRDAGSRRRGPRGPRARSRPPPHHRIPPPRVRLRGRPRRVPRSGRSTSPAKGLNGFYERDFFHDYTPGYLYVLWLRRARRPGGRRRRRRPDQGARRSWPTWRSAGWPGRWSASSAAATGWRWSPRPSRSSTRSRWFDSVVWGQVDSFGVVFLLLGAARAVARPPGAGRDLHGHRRDHQAAARASSSRSSRVVTIRRALWPVPTRRGSTADAGRRRPARRPARRLAPGSADRPADPDRDDRAGRLAVTRPALPAVRAVGRRAHAQAPYVASGLLEQIFATAGGYPYLTVNAYNPWALVAGDTATAWRTPACGSATAPWTAARLRRRASPMFGPIPAVADRHDAAARGDRWSSSLVVARRPDRLTILLGLAVLALAFFVVPTRVHERYALPVLRAGDHPRRDPWRWRIAYIVLTRDDLPQHVRRPDRPVLRQPGDQRLARDRAGDPRRVGRRARRARQRRGLPLGARPAALAARMRRLEDELAATAARRGRATGRPDERGRPGDARRPAARASRPRPAPPAGAHATPRPPPAVVARRIAAGAPWPRALAPAAAVAGARCRPGHRARPSRSSASSAGSGPGSASTPIRPDRSARSAREGGGRLDRLDLWLIVVLVVGDAGAAHVPAGRAVPDALRRGLPRADRDRVPPGVALRPVARHLRVDPPAPGQVRDGRRDSSLWGEDHVSATSDLGVPVRAAAVEPRRDRRARAGRSGRRAPPRRDRDRDPDLRPRARASSISTIAGRRAPARWPIDDTGSQLVIGYDDGGIATLDLDLIGAARRRRRPRADRARDRRPSRRRTCSWPTTARTWWPPRRIG